MGSAEKFYLLLDQLPHYKVRVKGLLLKSEFGPTVASLLPDIQCIAEISEGLLHDESLKDFLRFTLHAGNFINAVSSLCVF